MIGIGICRSTKSGSTPLDRGIMNGSMGSPEPSSVTFFSNMKWACIGAAGVAFVVAYHKWYSRQMEGVFNRELVLPAYRYLEKWGLDYGSSMADNYFHGYLEIILPAGLQNHRGFSSRVERYKNEQHLKEDDIMSDRIFVIIHKSGYSPDTYEKELPERFYTRAMKMEFQVDGRNGVRRRKYQSTVYKVSSADKKENVNVVMEGAPCLRQMYESAKHSEAVKSMSDDIIRTFIDQLEKKIKESAECQGMCELIYFDDSPGAAGSGKGGYHQLADELIRRVKLDKTHYGL